MNLLSDARLATPPYPRPSDLPAGMSLEDFLVTLMLAGYLLQFAGFGCWWLINAAPKSVAKRWHPISSMNPLFVPVIYGAGFCAAMAWPLLAADVEAWPAAALNHLQKWVLGFETYWVTFFTLEIIAFPIPVFMIVTMQLWAVGILKAEHWAVRLSVALSKERRNRRRRRR